MRLLISSLATLFIIVIHINGTCQESDYTIGAGQIELFNDNLFEYTPDKKSHFRDR